MDERRQPPVGFERDIWVQFKFQIRLTNRIIKPWRQAVFVRLCQNALLGCCGEHYLNARLEVQRGTAGDSGVMASWGLPAFRMIACQAFRSLNAVFSGAGWIASSESGSRNGIRSLSFSGSEKS